MNNITLKEIISAVQGELICGDIDSIDSVFITDVSIDSRDEMNGKLFVPFVGNRVDGHDYILDSFAKGSVCCLTEKDIETHYPVIKVSSTFEALKDLAEYYISTLKVKTVGITGSVGKTTTKDMIGSVLSQKYKIIKTEGNHNNEIGLPLTVFKIEDCHQYAILEMGMSCFGEINNLSKIAKPNMAVITNIGVSHIENLGSIEGILEAKSEIFNHMTKDGYAVLNGDDKMLLSLKDKMSAVYYYGTDSGNNVYADNITYNGIESTGCYINFGKERFHVEIPYPGKHMVLNALAAATIGFLSGLTAQEIKKGIETFKLSKMRMDIIRTWENGNTKVTIINDVYNASPASMEAAIDTLTFIDGRKVCILGDMFELGAYAKACHIKIGKYAVSKEIDVIIFIGEISKYAYDASIESMGDNNSNIYYYANQDELFKDLRNIIEEDDIILVKASRGMGFERTVEKLKNL